jgi:AbrB family looped-hinge helix DNA binding protein
MAKRSIVRVQERGQVTLPAAVRRRLGLKKGDRVAVVATADGALITRQETIADRALDRLGAILRGEDLALDDLIESGRELRADLLAEYYGIQRPDGPD